MDIPTFPFLPLYLFIDELTPKLYLSTKNSCKRVKEAHQNNNFQLEFLHSPKPTPSLEPTPSPTYNSVYYQSSPIDWNKFEYNLNNLIIYPKLLEETIENILDSIRIRLSSPELSSLEPSLPKLSSPTKQVVSRKRSKTVESSKVEVEATPPAKVRRSKRVYSKSRKLN